MGEQIVQVIFSSFTPTNTLLFDSMTININKQTNKNNNNNNKNEPNNINIMPLVYFDLKIMPGSVVCFLLFSSNKKKETKRKAINSLF